MKKAFTALLSVALFIFLANNVSAGISLGEGSIVIPAGQTAEMCNVWVYASQDGGTYHVETTGELKPLTVSITPNDFSLSTIDCPQETNARRSCITEKCLSGDQSSCRVICVKFAAPLLMEWNTERVVYEGSILNSIKIGAATVKEPFSFSVYVEPLSMLPVVSLAAVIVVVIVILSLVLLRKRKKKNK